MITFTKSLSGILNAFNNNLVEFSSNSVLTSESCEITIGSVVLNITPINDVFTFNFKEVIRALINTGWYKDSIVPDIENSGYVYPDPSLYLSQPVTYKIIFEGGTTESVTHTYTFTKSVKQPMKYFQDSGDIIFLTPYDLRSLTNHYVVYYEGYPFDFAILSDAIRTVTINNNTNGQTTTLDLVVGVNRIFVSQGSLNFTFSDLLVLNSGINELEFITENGSKTLFLEKVESDCAPYLKFFSDFGSYGYMRFQKVYRETVSVKANDTINTDFLDISETYDTELITGVTSDTSLRLTAERLTERQFHYLRHIMNSPRVDLYLEDLFQQQTVSSWRGVRVKDASYSYDNRREFYSMTLNITFNNLTM